jgi:predicted rRNA methylase YqxC with S4 and FtsJ domains
LILPKAAALLKSGGNIISLLKPHYEAHNAHLTPEEAGIIAQKTKQELCDLGFEICDLITSPVLGEKGKNTEYLYRVHIS